MADPEQRDAPAQDEQHSEPDVMGDTVTQDLETVNQETSNVLKFIHTQFTVKVEEYLQDRLAALQAEGCTEDEAHQSIMPELERLECLYQIWRIILTEDKYQKTEGEMLEAQEGAELYEWFTSFGGGVISPYQRDVLLCSLFPGSWNGGKARYRDLLDYLQREYPNVPDMEFLFLKNKIMREHDGSHEQESRIESEEEGGAGLKQRAAKPAPVGLRPIDQELRGLRDGIPALPTEPRRLTGRTMWLHENARIARMYERRFERNWFSAFFTEIGISPGFRIFFTIWLVGVAVVAFFEGFHVLWTLLDHMFVPYHDSGYAAQATGLFMFLLMLFFIALFFTIMERIFTGWILMDDESFYGDQDYAASYNAKRDRDAEPVSNPISRTTCPHLLPPCYTKTFLMLPGGKKSYVTRKVWMLLLVTLTIIIPFLYSLISVGVAGENVFDAVGLFVNFNVACVASLVGLYYMYMWYYALRKKYRAVRECKLHDERWRDDVGVLQEFAFDERSVRRNLLTLLVVCVPIFVLFWFTSWDKVELGSYMWVATAGALLFLFIAWREMWRVESLKDKIPISIIIFTSVMIIVGIIGAITDGGGTLVTFVFLLVLTQAFALRHRPTVHVDETAWLLAFLRKVDARARERGAAQTPKTPGLLQASIKRTFHEIHDAHVKFHEENDPNTERSWVPCPGLWGLIASCIASCCSCCKDEDAEKRKRRRDDDASEASDDFNLPPVLPSLDRGFWRLPSRYWGDNAVPGNQKSNPMYEPTDKLVLTANPRFMLYYGILFFIAAVVAFTVMAGLDEPNKYYGNDDLQAVTATEGAGQTTYPVCRLRWGSKNMSTVDLAFLNRIALSKHAMGTYADLVESHFGVHGDDLILVPWRQCFNAPVAPEARARPTNAHCPHGFAYKEDTPPPFLHFFSEHANHSYFVVRQEVAWKGDTMAKRPKMRDIEIWGASMTYQTIAAVFPFLRFLSPGMAADFVEGVDAVRRAVQPDDLEADDYLSYIPEYVAKWKADGVVAYWDSTNPRNITFTDHMTIIGHGGNGGAAKIVAGRLGVSALTFNAPGTRYIQSRYRMTDNLQTMVNILPVEDVSAIVDKQTGGVQHIRCTKDTMAECHHFETTMCELLASCGDDKGRWYKFTLYTRMGKAKQKADLLATDESSSEAEVEGKKDLFGDGSSGEESSGGGDAQLDIKINREYAAGYDQEKRRKELQRLADTYEFDEDSSEGTEEDEDGTLLNHERDLRLMEAWAALKRGDKDAAASQVAVVNKEVQEHMDSILHGKRNFADKDDKKLTLKDYMRDTLMEKGAEGAATLVRDEDRAFERKAKDAGETDQDAAKRAFLDAVEEEEDGLVVKKVKGEDGKKRNDDGARSDPVASAAESERLVNEKLAEIFKDVDPADEKEMFLKNFFLKQAWQGDQVDMPDDGDVDELVGEMAENDDFIAKQIAFEENYEQTKYHHQEQGASELASHPRAHLIDSLRKEDSSRKAARERKKQREEEAKVKRDEEVKRMKHLKRQEMSKKVEELKKIVGKDAEDLFDGADMDEDFDPEKWDAQLGKMFNDDYYNEDDDWEPSSDWGDMSDVSMSDLSSISSSESESAKKSKKKKKKDAAPEKPKKELTKEEKKEMEKRKKQLVQSKEADIQKEMEAYDKLDYHSMVDGHKVRFKYKNVNKEDFGLKPEDILQYDDRSLNNIAPLKFYAPYRSKQDNVRDRFVALEQKKLVGAPEEVSRRASNKYRKGMEPVEVTMVEHPDNKHAKRKKKQEEKAARKAAEAEAAAAGAADADEGASEKKGKKRKRDEADAPVEAAAAEEPKKKKKKKNKDKN